MISITVRGSTFQVSSETSEDKAELDFWESLANDSYEPDTIGFIERNVGPSTVFLDCGAAIGAMALFSASLGARVEAFEPNPMAFETLVRNMSCNPEFTQRLNAHRKALSTYEGRISFTSESDPTVLSSIVIPPNLDEQGSKPVEVVKFSGVIKDMMTNPDLNLVVKMDIEGAEYQILWNADSVSSLSQASALLLLSLHPGFYRPVRNRVPLIRRFASLLWRYRNYRDHVRLYKSLTEHGRIMRMNLQLVPNSKSFARLAGAGACEFVVDFR